MMEKCREESRDKTNPPPLLCSKVSVTYLLVFPCKTVVCTFMHLFPSSELSFLKADIHSFQYRALALGSSVAVNKETKAVPETKVYLSLILENGRTWRC